MTARAALKWAVISAYEDGVSVADITRMLGLKKSHAPDIIRAFRQRGGNLPYRYNCKTSTATRSQVGR